ncbi:MAG: DUF6152 family protein [Burkholderiaceae bacterium]
MNREKNLYSNTMSPAYMGLMRLMLAVLLLSACTLAMAHHGWRWTKDGQFELTGLVEKSSLGNPHGVLIVDADGEKWTVEVGQPWRNERAGLQDSQMQVGAEITFVGKRSVEPKETKMKAERLVISGKNYDLYPERLKATKNN